MKNPRAETRTDCLPRMGIVFIQEKGKYQLNDLKIEHNHALHLPKIIHMMPSQRKTTDEHVLAIELASDCRLKTKQAYELKTREVDGKENLRHTKLDQKNYLQNKRQRDLMYGEARAILKYYQKQSLENPSFFNTMQLYCEEQITNVFWGDPIMIIDYAHFGDVITSNTPSVQINKIDHLLSFLDLTITGAQ